MTDWWAVAFSCAGVIAALGGSGAAWWQARASKIAAKEATTASDRAARIAADALRETTKLTADLAEGGELKRWRREKQLVVLGQFLSNSQEHAAIVDRSTRRKPSQGQGRADVLLGQMQVAQLQFEFLATPELADAVFALVTLHAERHDLSKRLDPATFEKWVVDMREHYAGVVLAARVALESPGDIPGRLTRVLPPGTGSEPDPSTPERDDK